MMDGLINSDKKEHDMTQDYIPAVLLGKRDSISTERALKQIRELLDNHCDNCNEDRLNASLDDIDTMLECIK